MIPLTEFLQNFAGSEYAHLTISIILPWPFLIAGFAGIFVGIWEFETGEKEIIVKSKNDIKVGFILILIGTCVAILGLYMAVVLLGLVLIGILHVFARGLYILNIKSKELEP